MNTNTRVGAVPYELEGSVRQEGRDPFVRPRLVWLGHPPLDTRTNTQWQQRAREGLLTSSRLGLYIALPSSGSLRLDTREALFEPHPPSLGALQPTTPPRPAVPGTTPRPAPNMPSPPSPSSHPMSMYTRRFEQPRQPPPRIFFPPRILSVVDVAHPYADMVLLSCCPATKLQAPASRFYAHGTQPSTQT